MQGRIWTILAFVVAPIVPALAISLRFYGQFESENLVVFPLVYPVALAFTLLFGVPAFVWGERLNLIRWWSAPVAGSLIGLLVATLLTGTVGRVWFQPEAFQLFAGSWAIAGSVFWLVWRVGHRD
jgi:hypothetical protein